MAGARIVDVADSVKERAARRTEPSRAASCPRCGDELSPLPALEASALGGVTVRRCGRCGARSTEAPQAGLVWSCEACGLPFVTEDILPQDGQICPPCRDGRLPADLPTRQVAEATERQVLSALFQQWRFVKCPAMEVYVDRVAREVARRVEGAPAGCRVVLVDEPGLRTLALPSGLLLLSVGALAFLDDEAELAFVLAHEIAHSASGDAAVRLVRLGFDAVTRRSEAPTAAAWGAAATDLVRLGYGHRRERDADARALEAVLALDYDADSVLRLLRRLHGRICAGDPAVAEMAVSHPPAMERIRWVERALWGRSPDGRVARVNREVFRRAVARETLTERLSRVDLSALAPPAESSGPSRVTAGWRAAAFWASVAAAVLGGASLGIWLWLR